MVQTWTANASAQVIIPDADVVKFYERFGYNPKDPNTDQGAVEIDVLKSWRKTPFDGHKLAAFVAVNPQKIDEVKQAIYYFGGAYLGLALPVTAQDQDIWDVVATADTNPDAAVGSWGGHAVPACAFDASYIYVITWGAVKKITFSFFSSYCEESYALVSADWIEANKKAPCGFDIDQLQADLKAIESA